MKAAFIESPGPASAVHTAELPRPVPGPGQALVSIRASAVNPVDLYIRSGDLKMALPTPYILGSDFAGVVEAVGAKVDGVKVGDPVWGSNQGWFGRQGTLAEYAVVEAPWLYPIPEGQDFAQAAAGALTGITAHLGLFARAKLQPGEIVLVNGAAGGVGSAAVQLAKWAGARVIATAGSAAKRAQCARLGADLVLDYRDAALAEKVQSFAGDRGGVQVWFEMGRDPDFKGVIEMMAQHGRIVLIAGGAATPLLPIGPFYFKDLSLLGLIMMKASAAEQRQAALGLNACFAAGAWEPLIDRSFPLEEAAAAYDLQAEATLGGTAAVSGKIIVVP